MSNLRPRRSVLYMPGANAKALDKAQSLECDAIIMDLEDAVAPEAKEFARETIKQALLNNDYGNREIVIRINGIGTIWFEEDLHFAVSQKPSAILIPKISSDGEMQWLHEKIIKLGGENIALWAMIETPMAIMNLHDICATALKIPFAAIVMGTNDLAKELRIELSKNRAAFFYALSKAVNCARAFGISPIDGVFNDIFDKDGFYQQCVEAKSFGFDGKTLIHPNQIEDANAVFAPSDAEIESAKNIVAAFEAPENKGKGVLKVDGKMAEILHYEIAKQILAFAQKIGK